jgi:hypothetical protein
MVAVIVGVSVGVAVAVAVSVGVWVAVRYRSPSGSSVFRPSHGRVGLALKSLNPRSAAVIAVQDPS